MLAEDKSIDEKSPILSTFQQFFFLLFISGQISPLYDSSIRTTMSSMGLLAVVRHSATTEAENDQQMNSEH